MSGTDLAYCLRACYAMSGTDMARGAVFFLLMLNFLLAIVVEGYRSPLWSYALPTPCPQPMRVIREVRGRPLRTRYAISGTAIAYGARFLLYDVGYRHSVGGPALALTAKASFHKHTARWYHPTLSCFASKSNANARVPGTNCTDNAFDLAGDFFLMVPGTDVLGICYAHAMRCPVLKSDMLLPGRTVASLSMCSSTRPSVCCVTRWAILCGTKTRYGAPSPCAVAR
eukprot:2217743-Rhodomonas_salina.2